MGRNGPKSELEQLRKKVKDQAAEIAKLKGDKRDCRIYKITGWQNFCRVFELPERYPEGFCFEGGHAVGMQLIDWFYPISQAELPIPMCTPEEWRKEVGPIVEVSKAHDDLHDLLITFVSRKNYIKANRKYLILTDFGAAFTFMSKESK